MSARGRGGDAPHRGQQRQGTGKRQRPRPGTSGPPKARRTKSAAKADTTRRVLRAVSGARDGKPLSQAARSAHTTTRTIRKYVPRLVQQHGRRLFVLPIDRMKRPLRVLTPYGAITLDIRNSRSASLLGRYWNAVDQALLGRPAMLREFRGKVIRVDKVAYPYVTDLHTLRRLAQAGEVQFEDLYDSTR